jgi:Toprim-like/DNA primase catalytic core, N-terminal domain
MSINLDTGLWRCFKTHKSGNFITIYSVMEGIPYKKAYEQYLYDAFITEDDKKAPAPEKPKISKEIQEEFLDLEASDTKAIEFLKRRGLYGKYRFLKSSDPKFSNRVIIPFYNFSGKVFYFQARALSDVSQPKYLNCKNLDSRNILLPFEYDSDEPLYITEGVFDALSLKAIGLNATTTLSCSVSKAQMEQLKFYRGKLVVAYDSDDAGMTGARKFLRAAAKEKLYVFQSTVPTPFKDWNEWYCCTGGNKNDVAFVPNPLSELSLSLSSL